MANAAARKLSKLLKAIQGRDVAGAVAALDAGADPSGRGAYDVTPLSAATGILQDEAVRNELTGILLARGANPNDRGVYKFDDRPVLRATFNGYEAVVRMLIDSGGFPRDEGGAPARNSDGSTLLALACTAGIRWLAELALAEGCRADEVDNYGSTALHYATSVNSFPPRPGKDTAFFINWLLDHGAPLEHQRPGDWGTAMHWAVGMGDPAAVRALVDRGAQLEARTDRRKQTPLIFGAQSGTTEAIKAALAAGADVTAVDTEGSTPLHRAALRVPHPEADAAVVEALLAAGVDANARDGAGRTALAVAVEAVKEQGRRRGRLEGAQAEMLAALREATSESVAG